LPGRPCWQAVLAHSEYAWLRAASAISH